MTNRFLISVAAAALIAGTTGFANAQGAGGMNKEGAGSTVQQNAPSTGGAAQSAPQRGDAASEKAGASESKSMGSGKQVDDSTKGGQKTQPTTAQSKEMGKERMDNAQSKDGMGKDGMKNNAQSKEPGKDRMDNAQSKDGMSKDGGKTNAQTDSKPGTTTGNAATSATAAPPAEKQTQIRTAIKSETSIRETTNVNFNISVGTVVPAGVHFHPVPARIVEIYPEWRGYEIILVSGRYIIVRPRTHEIVYIIEG
jgi:hypothetical protein